MKALKSPLARQLLADPKAQGQLRRFLAGRYGSDAGAGDAAPQPVLIELRSEGRTVRVRPVIVPKAA